MYARAAFIAIVIYAIMFVTSIQARPVSIDYLTKNDIHAKYRRFTLKALAWEFQG